MNNKLFVFGLVIVFSLNLFTIFTLIDFNSKLENQNNKVNIQRISFLEKEITNLEDNLNYVIMSTKVNDKWIDNYEVMGLYSMATEKIVLNTRNKSNKHICRVFFHELGHSVDFKQDGEIFVYKERIDKELFANEYRDLHAWRCEGLE